jgi:hypothetical protein
MPPHNHKIRLINRVARRLFLRKSQHSAVITPRENNHLPLAGILPCGSERVEIGFGAGVGEADVLEVEACAEEGCVPLLGGGGAAEGEADGVEGGEEGGAD